MLETPQAEVRDGQSIQLAVSNAMVKIYKEMFGRGPTKARTDFAGPDLIVTTLENTLTAAERNLVALGEHQRLRDARMFFQYASERELRASVEQILGRKVRAFVSGIDVERDLAVELFYLEPACESE